MRLSWKSLTLMSVAAVSLIGGGWGYLHDASAAAPGRPKNGAKAQCRISRDPVVSVNKGPLTQAKTQGVIAVGVGQTYLNSDGLEVTELKIEDTLTRGKVEGIGELTITWDRDREMPVSTLTANQKESSFPATQVMRFNPVIVLNGETFRTDPAAAPANLVNADVRSFPPAAKTEYVLANSLTLVSERGNTITVPPGKAVTIQ